VLRDEVLRDIVGARNLDPGIVRLTPCRDSHEQAGLPLDEQVVRPRRWHHGSLVDVQKCVGGQLCPQISCCRAE
jgi:hypothetical protein